MSKDRSSDLRKYAVQTPLEGYQPGWAGQFDTFDDWVNRASRALSGVTGSVGERLPPCRIDAKGRRCHVGLDFQRARDEDAFPVRYFWTFRLQPQAPADRLTDFEIGYVMALCNLTNLHDEPSMASDALLELGKSKAQILQGNDWTDDDLKALGEMFEGWEVAAGTNS